MRKPVIAAFVAGLAFAAGTALAATVSYVGSYNIPKATGVEAYQKLTPSTGFTATFMSAPSGNPYAQSEMVILGGSTLSTGTINLTQVPFDGQKNCFYTKPIISTLTLQTATGQTLNDAVTATAATTRYCYIYSASNASWDRLQ